MRKELPKDFSLEQYIALGRQKNWEGAIKYVNTFLHCKVESSPYLHVLAGLCYEKMYEESGDENQSQAHIAALSTAYNLAPRKWFLAYLLGCAYAKNKDFEKAKDFFAQALYLSPKQPMALHGLAHAAYYTHNLPLAFSAIEKAIDLSPYDKNILRSASMICAAVGEGNKARAYLTRYESIENDKSHMPWMKERLQEWDLFYRRDEDNIGGEVRKILTASGGDESIGDAPDIPISDSLKVDDGQNSSASPSQKTDGKDKKDEDSRFCIVDCYLLRVTDSNSTSKGRNILSAFAAGIGLSGDNIFSLSQTKKNWWPLQSFSSVASGLGNALTQNFGFGLTVGALSYNINIANIQTNHLNLLAQPTLYVMSGVPASFLSGDTITGAVKGGSAGGSSFTVDVGYKVDITLISINCVKGKEVATMDIKISGSLLNNLPNLDVGVDTQSYRVSRSIVSTRVEVPMGNTVMLGGIYQREDSQDRERVPLLGDIPFLQYFFGQTTTNSQTKSIMFFAVPRYQESIERASRLAMHKLPIPCDMVEGQLSKRGILSQKKLPTIFYIIKRMQAGRFSTATRNADLLPVYWGETCIDMDNKVRQLASFLIY